MKDQYADRYGIQLNFLREHKNVHQREAPADVSFRVIGPRSPKTWRREVEKLARYFRREMGFDFPPYTANESDFDAKPSPDRVLVFSKSQPGTNTVYFIGAIGVRWAEWFDAPPCWSLTWAWLHPYERRKGHLTRAWPILIEMFPNPHMEPPLSEAMERFLEKRGHYSTIMNYET